MQHCHQRPPSSMPLLSVGSQSYYFYLKPYTRLQREKRREREREGRRGSQRQSGRGKLWFFWSRDRCFWCVCVARCQQRGGLCWFTTSFQKGGVSSRLLCVQTTKPPKQRLTCQTSTLSTFGKSPSCYADATKTHLFVWQGHFWCVDSSLLLAVGYNPLMGIQCASIHVTHKDVKKWVSSGKGTSRFRN